MEKLKTICVCLLLLCLVVAITVSAIYFEKPAILWWYIAPALIAWDII